ncbi:hypothetical protein ACTJK5_10525 [Agrobacterium sp. 22094]|uniref:hypothetical protein n=1 Tax=Agrobacterium sp. 22094 TaxID=3453872 RepID=UPI003F862E59
MAGLTAARRRFGVRPGLHVESLDREQLVTEALIRIGRTEIEALDLYDFDADATASRLGWHMAARTGTDFRIGRRLLQLTAPGEYLMPPIEFRLSRQTEPTDEQMYQAPIVTPWSIHLWQSGSTPAEWRVNGSVYHREWLPRIWSRLLYLHREKAMALTDDGWVRLGKRI